MKFSEMLTQNPGLLSQAKSCKSEEELWGFFHEKGVDLNKSILKDAFKYVENCKVEELSKEALKDVSGGDMHITFGDNAKVDKAEFTDRQMNIQNDVKVDIRAI